MELSAAPTSRRPRTPGRPGPSPLAAALALTLVAGCSGGGGGGSPDPIPTSRYGSTTVLPGACASGPGAVPGAECYSLAIDTALNATAYVELRVIEPPAGQPFLGTVIVGSGGLGIEFVEDTVGGPELIDDLLALGFQVVDRRWESGWFADGPLILAQSARYAVLVHWIRTYVHTSGVLVAVGNSGGAAEIAYALAAWEGNDLLDIAVLSGGPPLTRLDYLCEVPASAAWATQCATLTPPGPLTCGTPTCEPEPTNAVCPLLPPGATTAELVAESILHPTAELDYPTTVVEVLFGADDCTSAVPLGMLWANAITSPLGIDVVPNTPHLMSSTPEGRAAIVQVLKDALGLPDAEPSPSVRLRISVFELE